MSSLTAKYAEPAPYRRAAAALLFVAYGFLIALDFAAAPAWLVLVCGAFIMLPAYILLCVLTYHRLKDAWLSGGWVILMIVLTHFGPDWRVSTHVDFSLGDATGLIPLLLAWFAPARWGNNPATA